MKCEVCGRDRPVTYRSQDDGERSVCADCIRAEKFAVFGAAVTDALTRIGRRLDVQLREALGLTAPKARDWRRAGEEAGLAFARAVQDTQDQMIASIGIPNPLMMEAHTLTVDEHGWSLEHPVRCQREHPGGRCEVDAAAEHDLDVPSPAGPPLADGRYWCWLNLDTGGIRVVRMEPETPQEPEPPKPRHQNIPPYCWIYVTGTPYSVYNGDAANRTVTVSNGTLWLGSGPGQWGIRPWAEEP